MARIGYTRSGGYHWHEDGRSLCGRQVFDFARAARKQGLTEDADAAEHMPEVFAITLPMCATCEAAKASA